MSRRSRFWLGAGVTAGLLLSAAFYERQDRFTEELASTRDVRGDDVATTEAAEQPLTEALLEDRSEEAPEKRIEGSPQQPRPLDDVDERIRAFTTPVERALAGMEDVTLKIPLTASPEFMETLRQFAAENDDPNWSATTESRIFSEIAQATGLRAGAIQVDCRTTMCRVLLTNPGSAPNPRYSSFNALVASFGLEELWVLAMPDENGTPINFAYISRGEGPTARSE